MRQDDPIAPFPKWTDVNEPLGVGSYRYYKVDRVCTNCRHTIKTDQPYGVPAPALDMCTYCGCQTAGKI